MQMDPEVKCAEMESAVLLNMYMTMVITDKTSITVETLGGIKYLDLTVEDGKVEPCES